MGLTILMLPFLMVPAVASAQGGSMGGKNWGLNVGATVLRDDNLIGLPSRAPVPGALANKEADDTGIQWNANLFYKHNYSNKLQLKFDYDVRQTLYKNNSNLDLTTQIFGAGSTFKLNPLVNITLDYKYIYNNVSGQDFSGIHYISPAFNYMNKTFGLTRLAYTYMYINNWTTDLRDINSSGFSLDQYYFFSNFKRRINIGYKWVNEDAETNNIFDKNKHVGKAGFKTPLVWGINFSADASFAVSDYNSRLIEAGGARKRSDWEQRYSGSIDKELISKWGYLQNLVVHAKYEYYRSISMSSVRNFDNNHFEVGFDASF